MPVPIANRNDDGTVDVSFVFSGQHAPRFKLTISEVVALIAALAKALR